MEEEEQAVMVNDIARAYVEAPVVRAISVELPEEDGGGRNSILIGMLRKASKGQ